MKPQKDKLMHFGACCAIAVAAMVFYRIIAAPLGATITASFMISFGVGIGKEYGDKVNPYNKWDWYDVLYDFIGAVSGTVLGLLLWL